MVEELRHAVEDAQRRLSEEKQRRLAERIEVWLDELEWDEIVRSPRGQQTLARLVAEADEEIARGEVEDGGFGD